MKFIARLGVGFLISFSITAILSGGLQGAVGLLVISIVCTAGIGLVFWIPVWWFVGFLVLHAIAALSRESSEEPESKANPTRLSSRDFKALKEFIGESLRSGMAVDEMKRRLEQGGWRKADIEIVYQICLSHLSTTQGG